MADFSIGDKVTHDTLGPGEIVFGPLIMNYGNAAYAVRMDNGEDRCLRADKLTARAGGFAVGDEAVYIGHRVKVIGGPVVGYLSGDTRYLVEFINGPHAGKGDGVLETILRPVPAAEPIKAGDRIRVTTDRANSASVAVGDEFTVKRLSGSTGVLTSEGNFGNGWYFNLRNVERIASAPITFAYRGVTYDLSARYRDTDGDVWSFALFGTEAVGGMGGAPSDRRSGSSLAEVVDEYGPLSKV